MKIFFLLIGGALGTLARYVISTNTNKLYPGIFPYGTFLVNLIGSFIIGFLWGLFEVYNISTTMRTFIFVGILGGFTTFSSFSVETFNLFRDGEIKIGITYVLASNLIGFFLVFAGFLLSKGIINSIKI